MKPWASIFVEEYIFLISKIINFLPLTKFLKFIDLKSFHSVWIITRSEPSIELLIFFENSIKKAIEGSDLVIIHTEWNDFKSINFKNLVKKKKFIIYDMRNIYSPEKIKEQGLKYFSIGR